MCVCVFDSFTISSLIDWWIDDEHWWVLHNTRPLTMENRWTAKSDRCDSRPLAPPQLSCSAASSMAGAHSSVPSAWMTWSARWIIIMQTGEDREEESGPAAALGSEEPICGLKTHFFSPPIFKNSSREPTPVARNSDWWLISLADDTFLIDATSLKSSKLFFFFSRCRNNLYNALRLSETWNIWMHTFTNLADIRFGAKLWL